MKHQMLILSLLVVLTLSVGWSPLPAAAEPTASGGHSTVLGNQPSASVPTGIGGKRFSDIGPFDDQATAIAIQSDNKVVVAGSTDANNDSNFAVVRYTAAGALDTSFGGDGIVLTDFGGNDQATALMIQPDGKLVVAGSSDAGGSTDFALARYLPNGTPDSSLSDDGKLTTDFGSGSEEEAHAAILQTDGKIVVAGASYSIDDFDFDFALARYTASGNLDPSFSDDGKLTTDLGGTLDMAAALVIQPDGKLVAAGSNDDSFALARYTASGNLDASFSGDGKATTAFSDEGMSSIYGLALTPDGKLVAAGQVTDNGDFALARYTASGNLDTSFSGDGKLTTDFGSNDRGAAIVIEANSTIVVAGSSNAHRSNDFALARYTASGNLDPSFSGDGKLTTDFFGGDDQALALARQSDGRLVAAGFAQRDSAIGFAVARYQDGALEISGAVYLPLVSKGT
jgi:uncharacterized delta-60 repeat protein